MSEFLGALREPHHGFSEFCGALGLFLFAGVCHRLFLTAFFAGAGFLAFFRGPLLTELEKH
jgi:hypothetical protein